LRPSQRHDKAWHGFRYHRSGNDTVHLSKGAKTMSTLRIRDLPEDRELDDGALCELRGGWTGFLGGLVAPNPGSRLVPSVMNNYFIDYDQTVVQQNPVNVILEGSSNVIGSLNITPVNVNSPVNVLQDVGTP
jgi:hypothetical protein